MICVPMTTTSVAGMYPVECIESCSSAGRNVSRAYGGNTLTSWGPKRGGSSRRNCTPSIDKGRLKAHRLLRCPAPSKVWHDLEKVHWLDPVQKSINEGPMRNDERWERHWHIGIFAPTRPVHQPNNDGMG